MVKINKKLISITLVFTLIILLSTISHAKPFTEAFKGGLIQINDFFEKEQYKAYAKTIDFFVFSLLFIAVYLQGVKYAFKEVKRPEQVIAILLGLTTAFLLVLGDYSVIALLPFVNWLLYFLLFILIWWLLKDMKSKFWRFILALLLTILLIALFQALFWGIGTEISCPSDAFPYISLLLAILLFIVLWLLLKDIKNSFGRFLLALFLTIVIILIILALLKGSSIETSCPGAQSVTSFFDDFTNSLKGVDIGSFTPSTPQFLRDLTLREIPTPSPPSGLLQQIEPPDKKKAEEDRPTIQQSELGKIFDVDPKGFANQDAYNKAVIESGKKKKKIGGTTYYLDEKSGQLYRDRSFWFDSTAKQDEILKEKQKIEQEKAKSAENLGLLFGVKKEEGMTPQEVENAIIKAGEKGKEIEGQKYYPEIKDDKLVLRRKRAWYNPARWVGGNEIIDTEQKPELKKIIEDERKRREQAQPPGAAGQPHVAEQPTPTPTPPPPGEPTPRTTATPPGKKGETTNGGTSWVWLLALLGLGTGVTLAAVPKTRKWAINKWKTRRKEKLEATIPEIIVKIDEVKEDIALHKRELAELHEHRTRLMESADKKIAFLAHIAGITEEGKKRRRLFGKVKQGLAYLYEKGQTFDEMGEEVHELIRTEGKLIDVMRGLAKLEINFLNRLRIWKHLLRRDNIAAESEFAELDNLITRDIINSVKEFFRVAEQEIKTEKDLQALLEDRTELIKKRFKDFEKEERWLSQLVQRDGEIITRLIGEGA